MTGYDFADSIRSALHRAEGEARRLRHPRVGSEHLLLALVCEPDSRVLAVLTAAQVAPDDLFCAIEIAVRPGEAANELATPPLPWSKHAVGAIELTITEARGLGHSYVGSEHLLLGLLAEAKGVGGQFLSDAGLKLDELRRLVRVIASPPPPPPPQSQR